MADIQASLDKIMDIDGALGAAIVDYNSGMTLGTISNRDLDMELAAAGNTEVVRSENEIIDKLNLDEEIEDILMSLEDTYHLISIFHRSSDIFIYTVLNREKANLALSRRTIEDINEDMEIS
jgi:predicted regulator of Ras-like GTPase activity (Roadblock/LC7/MglB family)